RRERDEAVGAGADGCLAKAVLPHPLEILLRYDPAGAGRQGPVERHEVGPRLLEPEPHASGVKGLDVGDPIFQSAGEDAAVALERELHVLGGDGVAVVELDATAQDE